MVASQLRTTGVNDPRVLAAMGTVSRERFVPEILAPVAYADAVVPLKDGRDLNTPMSTGKLLTEAAPQSEDQVLLIGAATGYSAAVLSRLVASVVAIEEDIDLAAQAKINLEGTGVKLIEGPLSKGHARGGPYSLIFIDGAVEEVPDTIIKQLHDDGRLATGLNENGVQRLALGRRAGEGFGLAAFADAASAVLPGFLKPRGFSF